MMVTQVFPAYRIFTDATADLNAALQSGLPQIDVIPMEVQVGEASYTYGPQGNLTSDTFYAMLRDGQFASTSQINPQTYRKAFEKALKSGYDVLYLCFSSGLSSTINAAQMCIDDLKEEYPQRKIICIDTLCASIGEGLLVHEAARLQAAGLSIDELAQWVEQHRLQVCHWFTVDTFDHLKHGGRVSAASAAMGTILNIKPLLHVDESGKLQPMQKPRGQRQAMRKLISCMEVDWTPELSRRVIIGHGNSKENADVLANMISDRFPDAQVIIADIGPIIGAHAGPGVLALIYFGNNR